MEARYAYNLVNCGWSLAIISGHSELINADKSIIFEQQCTGGEVVWKVSVDRSSKTYHE